MSEHEVEALPPDIEVALRADKLPAALPAGVSARLWSRIEASVAIPPTGGAGGTPGPAAPGALRAGPGAGVSTAGASVAGLAPSSVLAIGLGVGALLGAGAYAALGPTPAAEVREVVVDVPVQPAAQPPVAGALPPGMASVLQPAPAGRPAMPAPRLRARRGSTERPPLQVREPVVHEEANLTARAAEAPAQASRSAERNLITRAQTALARGRPRQALDVLAEHIAAFPDGAFTEEREALYVQALLSLGRVSRARARARRFMQRYPRSIFREAVEPALAE